MNSITKRLNRLRKKTAIEYGDLNYNKRHKGFLTAPTKRSALKHELLEWQKWKCGICKKDFKEWKNACMDHNHTTLKMRGLLCNGCNTGIGMFRESQDLLIAAIEYLNKHN